MVEFFGTPSKIDNRCLGYHPAKFYNFCLCCPNMTVIFPAINSRDFIHILKWCRIMQQCCFAYVLNNNCSIFIVMGTIFTQVHLDMKLIALRLPFKIFSGKVKIWAMLIWPRSLKVNIFWVNFGPQGRKVLRKMKSIFHLTFLGIRNWPKMFEQSYFP